jgi:hypothetical protein
MRIPATVPIAAILWSTAAALDFASAQIVEMAATKLYFQQLGRLAGSLNACSFQECPKRSKTGLACGEAEWTFFAPSESIRNASASELSACGATKGQIDELLSIYRAEVKTHELFACSMTFDETRQKYRAIMSAVEERRRTGTTCIRR